MSFQGCSLCYLGIISRQQAFNSHLCQACYDTLTPSSTIFSHGRSLYRYESQLRELVLRTKVHGDQKALRCLIELFMAAPAVKEEAKAALRLVAAPSSLWGRLHGRIDLPWFLAASLAKDFGLALHKAPFALHWRVFKRAQRQNRGKALSLQFPQPNDSIPTLIIDDIITTGFTLTTVAQALTGSSCRFLTLADAFKGKSKHSLQAAGEFL